MKFTLSFDMDNAAFEGDNAGTEAARILRQVAAGVENGATEGKARDLNGNTVGSWEVEGIED